MRRRFIETLTGLAEQDPRVLLLTGDLGYTVVEPFANRFPDRFINVGVAEQNMVGLATGLAEAGFIPFVYSIATFAVLRPFEFIRNGPILHQLPVRICGVGGGFEYGAAGPTHHAVEDVAVLRSQEGIRVICPADHEQAAEALRQTWQMPGPIYYRLGKDETAPIASLRGRFNLEKPVMLREGADVLLLALGPAARLAMGAAERLDADGIRAGVAVVAAVHPVPAAQWLDIMRGYRTVLTIEAHGKTGGLGSAVAEIIATHRLPCTFQSCATGAHVPECGGETYLLDRHGLSVDAIRGTVRQLVMARAD